MKLRKVINISLCALTILYVFAGCGTEESEQTLLEEAGMSTEQTTVDSGSLTEKVKGNKTVVIVKEFEDKLRNEVQKNIIATLGKAGYVKGQNAEIIEFRMEGTKKNTEIVSRIKELRPDIVLINSAGTAFTEIGKPLLGEQFPVVVDIGLENLSVVDENGRPKQNITGLYSMPHDLQKNSFKLLKRIIPLDDKEAVFITKTGFFKKEHIEQALESVGVKLKEFTEVEYIEDYQQAVRKYNADDKVGWMLVGIWPGEKRDGTTNLQLECGKWDVTNRKKPTVTYWETPVEMGILCGLGIDIPELGNQAAEMAVKILDGEKVENMKAEVPRKINIVLNQMNADQMNVKFPLDILGAAAKVFVDYEGNTKE